jgi:DNA gyrase subunit A
MAEDKIIQINIEDEMKTAYIDYSMSVIVSRALPDVRDGLKPVHRRVLYGMSELGMASNKPYKKSARIVGEVLGKYHPHGDASVYSTMVRLAQSWSVRYPFIDGQGNFGSIDDDPPAAMRYTEVRMHKIAEEMLVDLEKNTVDFRPNFDDSLTEPTVLPSKVPNLLVNGATGIAVGMATNMAPHNLAEVCDGIMAYIDNRDITIEELMKHIKAPDFPTGAIILGYEGVKNAFETGKGRIVMRAKTNFEVSPNGKEQIIITEVPYQVNPATLLSKVDNLVSEKIIDGLQAARDESDRDGMRIVFDLKKDAIANIVLNKLFKYTELQTSFSVNNIALVNGRPMLLNLKDLIHHFVEHRHEVVKRRTQYELEEAQKRAHILIGLIIAVDNLDEVIKIIRESKTPDEARDQLILRFQLSDIQSKAILDMRLRVLTGLEIEKLRAEYAELMNIIDNLKAILADEGRRMEIIKEELRDIKTRFGDARRSHIEYTANDLDIEDLIADEAVVITISHLGYVKRTSVNEYRTQTRGGRGSKGVANRSEDFVEYLFIATTHNYLLLFTEQGRCFWLKVYEIPEGEKNSKGRAIQNMVNIPADDKIKAYINVKKLTDQDYIKNNFVVMCTRNGIIKKTMLEDYSRPRVNGVNAITIREGDMLLEARLTSGNDELIIAKRSGKAIRFNENLVRDMGRTASGVKGVTLENAEDYVVGMIAIKEQTDTILVVSENGYGKRTDLEDYRITGRGGKGVTTLKTTDKTGGLITIKNVSDVDDLMIMTRRGITIRLAVKEMRVMGRATQGVRLINLQEKDAIASVTVLEAAEEIEGEELNIENGEGIVTDPLIAETDADNAAINDTDATPAPENPIE